MSTLVEIAEALAAALEPLRDDVEDLQIYPYFLLNPTPPAIDIYPGDPFQTGSGFDPAAKTLFWTVRARWTTADHDASQQGLLSLLDPSGLEAALYIDDTLGGVVDDVAVTDDSPTGYREYVADTALNGRLLGAEWRVQTLMSANGASPPPPAGLVLLDDFNRANGPAGTDWALVNIASAVNIEIDANAARLGGGAESASVWATDLFDADQAAEITVVTPDPPDTHLYMLLQVAAVAPTAFTGYLLDIELDTTEAILSLYRGNTGGFTTLQTSTGGYTYAAGDTWTLRKQGAVLTVERNGLPVAAPFDAVTDPAPLLGPGYAGVGGRNSSALKLDDFKAGNL